MHGHIVLEGLLAAAGPVCGTELGAYRDGSMAFGVALRLQPTVFRCCQASAAQRLAQERDLEFE